MPEQVSPSLNGDKWEAIAQLPCRAEWGPLCDPDVYWIKSTINESAFTTLASAYQGRSERTVSINSVTYTLLGFPDTLPILNFQEGLSESDSNNDGSTRPPSTTYSESIRTKNQEIGATINVIPIAGVPSKEKHAPITVDWLTSDAHAYEYGQLEIVLMGGRKQCRFFVGQLTDTLATLRPRSRIDIVFNGLLYRCLVDAIAFSQDLTSRTIGFMCDVISTSPAATPSTVYRPVVTNGLRGAVLIDAVAEGIMGQTFDAGAILIDAVVEGVGGATTNYDGDILIDTIVQGNITH